MRLRKKRVLVANILWALLVFVLLVIPIKGDLTQSNLPEYMDKVVHFILFGGMTFLLIELQENLLDLKRGFMLVIAVAISVLFGTIMEFIQEDFFKRSYEKEDIIADFVGSVVIGLLYPFIKKMIFKIKIGFYKRK